VGLTCSTNFGKTNLVMAPLARSRLRAEHEIWNLFDDSPLVFDMLFNNPPDCLVARQLIWALLLAHGGILR
jgi:hypothetical protein